MHEEEADLDLTPSTSKPRAPTSPQATPFSSAHAHRRVSEFLLADMVFPSSNPTRDYSTTSLKPSSQAFSPSFTHKPFFNAALPGRIPRVCGTAILDFSRPQQLLTRAAICTLHIKIMITSNRPCYASHTSPTYFPFPFPTPPKEQACYRHELSSAESLPPLHLPPSIQSGLDNFIPPPDDSMSFSTGDAHVSQLHPPTNGITNTCKPGEFPIRNNKK